ncbi:hypothetical protein [Arthrobacter sp.]
MGHRTMKERVAFPTVANDASATEPPWRSVIDEAYAYVKGYAYLKGSGGG